jgi:hypothetical protein
MCVVVGLASAAGAQEAGIGGAAAFPRTNQENQAAARARGTRPATVTITRSTPPGAVVARGRRAAAAAGRGGGASAPCEYNVGWTIEILEGAREVTVTPRESDCTLVLDSIQDRDVVEPGDRNLARLEQPGRGLWGALWQALFPTASAQTLWVERAAYHHIYTCGVACAGGIDGLTALQSFLRYSQTTDYPRQVRLSNRTFEWYCIAGLRWTPVGWLSNCQPLLETPGAPMFPGNTGWRVYNPWITGRVWGPTTGNVYASAQAEFDWNISGPNVQPRFYWHRLIVESVGRVYPYGPLCNSILQGSPVNGPIRSVCMVPGPEPLPY